MTTQNAPSVKYADMTTRQKAFFILKIALCIISFGFIYPNVMNE